MSIPQNLSATAVSGSQIDLSWDVVTGANGYDIERDGSVIAWNHSTNTFSDTGLSPSTLYTYRVRSVGVPSGDVDQALYAVTQAAAGTFSGGGSISDDFNRSDRNLHNDTSAEGWTWTVLNGGLNIVSNQLRNDGVNIDNWARAERDLGSYNQYGEVTITVTGNGDHNPGVMLRADPLTNTGYLVSPSQAGATLRTFLWKVVNGTYTQIAVANDTWASGDRFRAEIIGNTISVYRNGVFVRSWTDTSITDTTFTYAGAYIRNASAASPDRAILDDWEAGALVPSMTGGTETTPGDGYKYHTFTTSGTLTVVSPGEVEYLVVAGGGGGGGNSTQVAGSGGGGGGGAKTGTIAITADQTITVGAKGLGANKGTNAGNQSTNGGASSIGSLVTTTGGGGGSQSGGTGGSGGSGGGGYSGTGTANSGGSGTSGEGNNGGTGQSATGQRGGGGGGGKGSAGANATTTDAGDGGSGIEWPTGSGNFYAGGGGGGTNGSSLSAAGLGQAGGGDGGYYVSSSNIVDGTDATRPGSGGGGGGRNGGGSVGGDGADGIVIVRYPV